MRSNQVKLIAKQLGVTEQGPARMNCGPAGPSVVFLASHAGDPSSLIPRDCFPPVALVTRGVRSRPEATTAGSCLSQRSS